MVLKKYLICIIKRLCGRYVKLQVSRKMVLESSGSYTNTICIVSFLSIKREHSG